MGSPRQERPANGGSRRGLRGPNWDSGPEPDYRFSLANERTFLAWIRTSLALIAGGLALSGLVETEAVVLRETMSVALVLLGIFVAAGGYARWARNEDAMRHQQPLPKTPPLPGLLSLGVLVAAILVVVLLSAQLWTG